jgi:phenylpyruvate tautomerase PptA (4-oxalocrotonate tautomerase family)
VACIDTGIREGHSPERKNEIACRATGAICEMAEIPKEGVWVVPEDVRPPDSYASGILVNRLRK